MHKRRLIAAWRVTEDESEQTYAGSSNYKDYPLYRKKSGLEEVGGNIRGARSTIEENAGFINQGMARSKYEISLPAL